MAFKVVSIFLAAAVLQSLSTFVAASPVKERSFEFPENATAEEGNAWETSGYFEGDIILDDKYFRNGKLSDGKPARFENTTIPYEIAPEFDDEQKQAILQGFEEYHQKTCLRFRPKVATDKDWIYIEVDDKGCRSHVGRIGGKQLIRLKKSRPGVDCFKHGTIVHEVLHAVGFFHQHSTTDRDDYVKIVWYNILPETEHNFIKYSETAVTSFGVSYDYDSVMHYSAKAFSKNGQDTIIPKQPGVHIGQRNNLSPKDVQKVNIMYSCPAAGGYSVESLTDWEQWLEDSK